MTLADNLYVRAGVEFVHDIAAGAFPGAVLAGWMIRMRFSAASPDVLLMLEKASTSLWLIVFAALVLLGLTGAFRLGYWRLNVQVGYLEKKKRSVIVKHTAFVLLMLASITMMFGLVPK
jgi:hypothetical protein